MKDLSDILELSLDEMSEWGVMDWRRKYLVSLTRKGLSRPFLKHDRFGIFGLFVPVDTPPVGPCLTRIL